MNTFIPKYFFFNVINNFFNSAQNTYNICTLYIHGNEFAYTFGVSTESICLELYLKYIFKHKYN